MLKLPTVLLRHDQRDGVHYDWLIADPSDIDGRLWTARVALPSTQWLDMARFDLDWIESHRRWYLTWQGPIGNGRGSVVRVDEGEVVPRMWNDRRIVADVRMKHCHAAIDMVRYSESGWRARVEGPEIAVQDMAF